MICLIALIVFAFLGLFSVRYRNLTKEAFDCVFRRMTLRPCRSGLDRRIKNKLTKKLMKYPKMAKFTYKHFEGMSWLFTIILFVSLAFSINGMYNYLIFGNCNGESSDDFCVFNPSAAGCGIESCEGDCICPSETSCINNECVEGCSCAHCG